MASDHLLNLQEIMQEVAGDLPGDVRMGIKSENEPFEQLWFRLYPHGTHFTLLQPGNRRDFWELKAENFTVTLTGVGVCAGPRDVAKEIVKFFAGLTRS